MRVKPSPNGRRPFSLVVLSHASEYSKTSHRVHVAWVTVGGGAWGAVSGRGAGVRGCACPTARSALICRAIGVSGIVHHQLPARAMASTQPSTRTAAGSGISPARRSRALTYVSAFPPLRSPSVGSWGRPRRLSERYRESPGDRNQASGASLWTGTRSWPKMPRDAPSPVLRPPDAAAADRRPDRLEPRPHGLRGIRAG